MEYKIRFVPGNPKFDNLGVMKLSCDSSVDINSRIYGQAQIGRSEEFIFARVWSFETAPTAASRVGLTLQNGSSKIEMTACFDESSSLFINGSDCKNLLTAYLISGEDLQGEYWGAVMMLPASEFFAALGIDKASLPAVITANVYRQSDTVSSAGGEFTLLSDN